MAAINLAPVTSALGTALVSALSAVGAAMFLPAALFVSFWLLVWLVYPSGVHQLWLSYRERRLFDSASMAPSFRARRVRPLWASGRQFPAEVWNAPQSLGEAEGGAFEASGIPAEDAEVFM